jgi:hypothetical protein
MTAHARPHMKALGGPYGGFGHVSGAFPKRRTFAAHSKMFTLGVRQKVFNRTNNPTPTAGPTTVASTNIMKDFATIPRSPRTKRRSPPSWCPQEPEVGPTLDAPNKNPATNGVYLRKQ